MCLLVRSPTCERVNPAWAAQCGFAYGQCIRCKQRVLRGVPLLLGSECMNDRIFINAVDMDGAPVHVAVQQGRITSMASECPVLPHAEVVDVAGHVLLPGLM